MDFKVGDIITGVEDNGYAITTTNATMKVVEADEDGMAVLITRHIHPEHIDMEHHVTNTFDKFRLLSAVKKGKVKKKKVEMVVRDGWKKELAKFNKATSTSTTSYILLFDSGKTYTELEAPCHAAVRNKKKGIEWMITKVREGYGKTTQERAFIRWLINSPQYREFILNTTVPDVLERGLITDCRTAPSNLMMQGVLALRQIWEYPHIIKAWYLIKKGGVNKSLAFVLANLLGEVSGKGWELSTNNSGHQAIGSDFLDKEFVKNYMSCKPTQPNPPMFEESSYYGIAGLWNGTKKRQTYTKAGQELCPFLYYNRVVIGEWGDSYKAATDGVMVKQMVALAEHLMNGRRGWL